MYFCCTNYYSVLVPIHFFQALLLTSGQGHDTPNPSTSMQVSWSPFFTPSHAHASLPPDALKAFKMNKSDSGKQHKQYDTIIPKSNPGPCFWGQPQQMMTSSRQQKALKTTDLMSSVWRLSVHQYALLRARTAAWPGFSVSKKILSIKNQWLRHW